jgi:3',5'-cyclic AMP phosphodiesterase CpdA
MTPNSRALVLAFPIVLLLACGSPVVTPPDSGTAPPPPGGADAGDSQVATDTAGQLGADSATPSDAEVAADAGADSGNQADMGSTTVLRMPWTLIALPDTQYYSSNYPQIFDAQTNWIVSQVVALNIRYVVHEGDIVDNSLDSQWTNASHSLHLLDLKVPYALAIGNHDYPGGGGAVSRDTTLFDKYFSLSSLDSPSFKGIYEPGSASNSYHLFEVDGQSWLIVSLEFGPRDAVLSWADRILKANPSANAIVLTHAYLYADGTRFDHLTRTDQAFNPHTYGVEALAGGVNDGEEIWQKLIVNNANVRIVLCGHVHAESHLTSTRAAGPPVHQILADYQDDGQGGDGYLRIMTFQPNGAINVSSYSPHLKTYRTDGDNAFTLSL